MSLTARQTALYNDTCNLWQINLPVGGVDGKPGDVTFTLLSSAVVFGLFTRNPDMSTPQIMGRFMGDQLITADIARFDAAQAIDTGYVLKLTTVGHPLINTFWAVLGDPQVRPSRGNRKGNFKSVYVKRLPAAPEGVS